MNNLLLKPAAKLPSHAMAKRRRTYAKRLRQSSFLDMTSAFSLFFIFFTLFVAFIPPTSAAPSFEEPSSDPLDGPIIGIDLGTTYSCVGVYQHGKVDILANDQGNAITPSYVAFDPQTGRRWTGDAAKNQATLHPEHTVFDVKRLMGREFDDPTVQADRKVLPYGIVRGPNGKPFIEIPSLDEKLTPEQVSSMVLRQMKDIASGYLGQEVRRAVITVPAYFNKAQREATRDAATIAGLHVERIINEPTAAAIAYGLDAQNLPEDATVLVYDLGGGTFDVTLLTVDSGVFEVLATAGDTHLGGEDFDERVIKYFQKKLAKTQGVESLSTTSFQKLRKEVERVKRALSSQLQASIEVEELDFSDTLSRARFEELNHDLFQKTLEPIRQVLKDAKVKASDVDRIVLVGGSTRIPKVQQMVSDFFGGKQIAKGVDPDRAVAYGAAVLGGILSGEEGVNEDVVVLDVASLSQGIETVGGVMTNIIPRGTTIPVKKSQIFSTQTDNQSAVTIQIYEGERSMTKDNHLLGSFTLSGIPLAPRGVPQIEVTFTVDASGLLQVTAEEKGTGKAQNITITSDDQRLSKEEVERMVEEAERFAEEDRLWKERVEARQGLESYLYNLRNTADDDDNGVLANLSATDRKEFADTIDEGLDWLDRYAESADTEDLIAKRKELESVVNPIMRQAYSGSGGSGHQNGGEDDFSDEEL